MKTLAAWTGVGWFLAGVAVGWCLSTPRTIVEPPAPSVRQADGSLVLERGDQAKSPKAPHTLPDGAIEERRASVVVRPPGGVVLRNGSDAPMVEQGTVNPPSQGMAGSIPARPITDSCDCPPVHVDLSLVRMPDQTRRVVASSPDGQILSGLDIPISGTVPLRAPRWALSGVVLADPAGVRPGLMLQRVRGRVVAGTGIITDPGMRRLGIVGTIGVTW